MVLINCFYWSDIIFFALFLVCRLRREQWCSCCNAETVGCDVWQSERERGKRRRESNNNKDCTVVGVSHFCL